MAIAHPVIHQKDCLNTNISDACETVCTHCRDICPVHAINFNQPYIPNLNNDQCIGCAACARVCPTDAIIQEEMNPLKIIKQVTEIAQRGQTELHTTCSAVTDVSSDLSIPCHAAWDPILLACIAAEGIQTLHLNGINQCSSCPVRHGSDIMAKTEKDYALLNNALGVQLNISHQETATPIKQTQPSVPEPARRTFFRNLFPSMAQTAIRAAAQLNEINNAEDHITNTVTSSKLPLRLRLFLRALPHLQANFMPVPLMPSLPLGAIQADARCTACNTCVGQCPTEALGLKEFGENKVLEFQPDACIGCQQCVDICPEHAMETLPAISLPTLLTRKTRPLVMVPSARESA